MRCSDHNKKSIVTSRELGKTYLISVNKPSKYIAVDNSRKHVEL